MAIIAKGAEAELRREDGILAKERISKGYRLPELDEKLRKRRTSLEARLLREAKRAGVNTPKVLEEGKTKLVIEFIDGEKAKDILDQGNFRAIAEKIGEAVAKLHTYDIIHGDLTTSNMLVKQSFTASRRSFASSKMIITKAEREGSDSVRGKEQAKKLAESFSLWLIDFGLGFISKRPEDKAVDLYLLHEALESTHFDVLEETWAAILESYKEHYAESDKVIKALLGVEKRGRYKERSK